MENLSHDLLYSIALEMDLPELLNFCNISSRTNEKVCKTDRIWIAKLNRDFPDREKLKHPTNLKNLKILTNPKDLYILLWNLRELKQKFDFVDDIYTLYFSKRLDLSYKELKELPKTMNFLSNLKQLNLGYNKLEELPDNLPSSLEYLYVNNNNLKKLPNILPSSLILLNVNNNKLEKLPKTLPSSLVFLHIRNNNLEELPDTLPSSLEVLLANNNKLQKLPDTLPSSLKELNVNSNELGKIPVTLPSSLQEISVKYNYISNEEINRVLKSYPSINILK